MANTAGTIESWQKYDITVHRGVTKSLSGAADITVSATGDLYSKISGSSEIDITAVGDLDIT